ncbi:MAG TPA: hypothetical protein VGK86_15430 [Thermoanaerobaculia bacterium]|jgi:hypothetical protein
MRGKVPNRLLATLAFLAPLFSAACGATYSSPPPEPAYGDLGGSRYDAMRTLAGRLVDRLQATRDELRVSRVSEAEMPLLSDLLDRARRFRDRMEDTANPPRSVRDDVNELDRLARDYDARTRYVRASERAVESWNGALETLDRMRRLVSGSDVELPPEAGPYPTSPSGSVFSGRALEDLRRTAHEVVVRASLARDTAERAGPGYGDADRRLLADLSYFVSGARELDSRANAATVDRRDIGPFVDRLSDDARRIDSALRSSTAFSRAGSDWNEVLRLLDRLSELTR